MRKLIFTALLIVLQPVLVGCSNSSSEWIQGTWKISESEWIQGTWKISDSDDNDLFQFNSDGTFVLDFDEDAKGFFKFDDVYGTFATEGNQLTLVFDLEQDLDVTWTMTIKDKEANSFRLVDLNIDSKSSGDSETSLMVTRIE